LFSFVKELDDSTLELMKSFNGNARRLRSSPRVAIWVLWVGGNKAALQAWVDKHNLKNLNFSTISATDPGLAAWHLNPMAMNTQVIVCRTRKAARATFTDVAPQHLPKLEAVIAAQLAKKD
jgi:hypothetical protein